MMDFDVDGMTCGGCARAVEKAVRQQDAAAEVEVDLAARKVRVTSSLPQDTIVAAIEGAGYEVLR